MSGIFALIDDDSSDNETAGQSDLKKFKSLATRGPVAHVSGKQKKLGGNEWTNITHLIADFEKSLANLVRIAREREEAAEEEDDHHAHVIRFVNSDGERIWTFLGSLIPKINFSERMDNKGGESGTVLVGSMCWASVEEELKKRSHPILWGCLHRIILEIDTKVGLRHLKTLASLSRLDIDQFDLLGQALVERSAYPMTTGLLLAAFFEECGADRPSDAHQFQALSHKFTEMSVHVLNQMESDHLALMLLWIPTDFGRKVSAMSTAIDTQNTDFVSHSRVVRIISAMWSNPDLMDPDKQISAVSPPTMNLIKSSPYKWYRLPRGKFTVEAFLYALYLTLYTYLTITRKSLYDPPSVLEFIFWCCNGGFIVNEIVEVIHDTVPVYLLDWTNYLDLSIILNFFILLFIRFTATECVLDRDPTDYDCGSLSEGPKTIYYKFTWGLNAILLWIRASHFILLHPTLGPLLKMVASMLTDIYNFSILLLLFFLGFMFSFYYYVGDKMKQYRTLDMAVQTMFRNTIGDYDTSSHSRSSSGLGLWRSNISQLLLIFYTILGLVVLMNILVAMMATTFDSIADDSKREYMMTKASIVTTYDRRNSSLPPPLNIVVYVLWVFWFIISVLKTLLLGDGQKPDKKKAGKGKKKKKQGLVRKVCEGPTDIWFCQHCQYPNKDSGDPANLINLWFDRFHHEIDPADRHKIMDSQVLLCAHCNRPRRRASYGRIMLEKISWYMAIISMTVPVITIISALPGAIRTAMNMLSSGGGGKNRSDGAKFVVSYSLRSRNASASAPDVRSILENYNAQEISASFGNEKIQDIFDDLNTVDRHQVVAKIDEITKAVNTMKDTAHRLVRVQFS